MSRGSNMGKVKKIAIYLAGQVAECITGGLSESYDFM
jgi:hypothetical protein